MAVEKQVMKENYVLYLGDCIEVMSELPQESIHLSIYSPPFAGLYQYSSNPRDLSNSLNRQEFFSHYEFVVKEIERLTKPGRMTAVHCTDIPNGNTGCDTCYDFPGDVIRLHEKNGFNFVGRYFIWKEPLTVRNRTMMKSLAHKTIVQDSSRHSIANADQLCIFRKKGENAVPIAHPSGLTSYAGERQMPNEILKYKGWTGSQLENKFSHWIWRQYASCFWDDIRLDRVLKYREAREDEDEKHVHPLQLDVIERGLVLWSNPGETVLTPFMGVGSEVYGAILNNRKAIGIELKKAYFHQAEKNLASIQHDARETSELFAETQDGNAG